MAGSNGGQQPGAGAMDVDGAPPQPEIDDRTFYVGPKSQIRRDFMNMANPLQHGLSMLGHLNYSITCVSSFSFFFLALSLGGIIFLIYHHFHLVHDWGVVEKIWEHIFSDAFAMNPKEHPVLLAESSYNTPAIREKVRFFSFFPK